MDKQQQLNQLISQLKNNLQYVDDEDIQSLLYNYILNIEQLINN